MEKPVGSTTKSLGH